MSPRAGQIVAHVADRIRRVGQVAEVDHIILIDELAAPQHQRGGVAVDIRPSAAAEQAQQAAALLHLVPAQADHHGAQPGVILGQADLLALLLGKAIISARNCWLAKGTSISAFIPLATKLAHNNCLAC